MNLKEKIKNTNLFTNLQKINILVDLDKFSDEDKSQLESVINDYDESLASLQRQYKSELIENLETINNQLGGKVDVQVEAIKKNLDEIIK